MAPRAEHFKRIRQRMRRTLHYGQQRMDNLSLPLSKFVVDYFDKNSCFDFMDMDYAAKLSRDGCISPCTLVATMIYLERLKRSHYAEFQQSTAAELYLSAVVVATKLYNDAGLDEYVYNDEWAVSAGTSTARVNTLELKLLTELDWKLLIANEEFEETLNRMECWIAAESLRVNGFATYNEASVLSSAFAENLLQHVQRLFAFVGLVGFAYLIGISSILLFSAAIHSSTVVKPVNETTPQPQPVHMHSQQNDLLLNACFKKRKSLIQEITANEGCAFDAQLPNFFKPVNDSVIRQMELRFPSYPLLTSG